MTDVLEVPSCEVGSLFGDPLAPLLVRPAPADPDLAGFVDGDLLHVRVEEALIERPDESLEEDLGAGVAHGTIS
ncbi:hypothetical protein [Microvirga sesbaniae]|uniref:hypothetical protein n=1 Tax=Microvirga sesbaniae TaxID=681392 RepID=UPI0021C7CF3C|nr:hypothetical protein [Microvirga sp. HBU67692]